MNPKHDWNSWENYLAVHRRVIQNYINHFIIEDDLLPTMAANIVSWEGVIYCVDGLEIHVRKLQDVSHLGGRPRVRTRTYSYHALRRMGTRVVGLFRYDNVHQHGHADAHHRHRFDAAGNPIDPPRWVGVDGWPTLPDVIEELHAWWVAHQAATQCP